MFSLRSFSFWNIFVALVHNTAIDVGTRPFSFSFDRDASLGWFITIRVGHRFLNVDIVR